MNGGAFGPLAVLVAVLASDAWVFLDAQRRREEDNDVVATLGPATMSSPTQWLLGCLLLWILVVPLYLVARRAWVPI